MQEEAMPTSFKESHIRISQPLGSTHTSTSDGFVFPPLSDYNALYIIIRRLNVNCLSIPTSLKSWIEAISRFAGTFIYGNLL